MARSGDTVPNMAKQVQRVEKLVKDGVKVADDALLGKFRQKQNKGVESS
jgi:hypothetical protein